MSERNEQKSDSPDSAAASTARCPSLRWKVLQGVGASLMALAVLVDWPPPVETSLPQTLSFPLAVGMLVFVAGLIADKEKAGHP
ncbi:MAG TPA: hypothetical protein VKP13_11670 [Nitrospira sp.]|nr:hypothetical protein [Nitrospira sp.]